MNMGKNNKIMDSKAAGMIERFFNENGPTAATVGGALCLVAVVYAAFKASKAISKSEDEYEHSMQEIAEKEIPEDEKKTEIKQIKSSRVVRNVIAYKWVGLFGAGAIFLMFLSNYLNGAKIAGLTTALVLGEDKLKKIKDNAKELIGEEKLNEIKDKTYEDLIMNNFIDGNSFQALKVEPRNGQLFLDGLNGYLFYDEKSSLIEALEDAKKKSAMNHGYSTDEYYEDKLGIEPGEGYTIKWWGPTNPFEYSIRSISICGMVIECIEFEYDPVSTREKAGIPSGPIGGGKRRV